MRIRFFLIFLISIYIICFFFFTLDVLNYFSDVEGYNIEYNFSLTHLICIYLFSIVPIIILPIKGRKPSYVILWFVYFSHIIPTIVFVPIISKNFFWSYMIILFFSIMVFLSNIKIKLKIKLFSFNFKDIYLYSFLLVIFLFSLIIIIGTYGLSFDLPNITDVYSVREKFINNSNFLSSYVSVITGYIISPFLLLLGVNLFQYNGRQRRLGLIFMLFSILLSIQIYASSGLKSVAFASFVCLSFYIFIKNVKNIGIFFVIIITFSFFFLMLISNLFIIEKLDILLYHWFRRVFIVPGMNVNYFFDYIVSNNLLTLKGAPLIISEYYYGTSGSANSGLIGDSFTKYNYIGFIINGFIFLFILKLSDYIIDSRSSIGLSLMIPIAYAISNSSITTVFFTYGYILIVCFFVFFKKNIYKIEFNKRKNIEIKS